MTPRRSDSTPAIVRAALILAALGSWPGAHLAGAGLEVEPDGYFVDSTDVIAPRLASARDTTGSFTYAIHAECPDSTAAALLAIAEATYPPRGLILDRCVETRSELGPDTAGVALWWYRGTGAARVPYAVTRGAVEYYLNVTRLSREHASQGVGTQPLHWSKLSYEATIEPRASLDHRGRAYHDVYVASLELTWTYDDGTFLPYTQAKRVVVLNPGGRVLAVTGDGETVEKVAISPRRKVGRDERLHR